MVQYDFIHIESKWKKYWEENRSFQVSNDSKKPKYYVLDMFPYPSGAGLHVGHPLGYIASDIIARYKRHKGFNVLHPQGFDSFGLPAEQYAIQTGQHPAQTTKQNIARYKDQLNRLGFSFDWSREVQTSSPKFYQWTQCIFLLLFNHYYDLDQDKARPIKHLIDCFNRDGNKNINAHCDEDTPSFSGQKWNLFSWKEQQEILLKYRLTYLSNTEVNWCPELGTVLANDEVIDGVSERGGYPVFQKKMSQWSMRITAYAQRLLDGLNNIDWPKPVKEMQKNWIGRSQGAKIQFEIHGHKQKIEVFTTRPDTLYGATFMTLAPELDIVKQITTKDRYEDVSRYIENVAGQKMVDRLVNAKRISGRFTGSFVIHPMTNKRLPIWISDYVLAQYGTGAVMGVPAGDQRDHLFASHFNLPIVDIFNGIDTCVEAYVEKKGFVYKNSGPLNGLDFETGYKEIISILESKNKGSRYVNFRLKDTVFARQRYWGEPIPIFYKQDIPVPIDSKYLPLVLPEVEQYLPTKEGKPPLGNAKNWAWDTKRHRVVDNNLIDGKSIFPLELNTMPGWAGSSWYFNRYTDAGNNQEFASQKALNYWREVDLYIGGIEHATGHLLYSRFWQKFLFDLSLVPFDEYAKKLINQGMILGTSAIVYRKKHTQRYISKNLLNPKHKYHSIRVEIDFVSSSDQLDINQLKKWQPQFKDAEFILEDGRYIVGREVEKMSKSKFNVVNPDQICDQYGADTLRMYEMFLGPIDQAKPWNTAGITGVHNFLKKFLRLFYHKDRWTVSDVLASRSELKVLHQTIKKVTTDLERYSFNTCVSSFMIACNELTDMNCNHREILEPLTILLSPFAPHLSEELWQKLGHQESISTQPYPKYSEEHLVETTKQYPISFNGKKRFTLEIALSLTKDEIEQLVLSDLRTSQYTKGKAIKKIIVVSNRIVNIVV
ncbi:MAG: leucine--tRNA ligase [Flavobacteriaceae bacterium]|nr:leucine--tRNA ligase [Flavobacteriaceae bacterium]